jgi:hypothetical protein
MAPINQIISKLLVFLFTKIVYFEKYHPQKRTHEDQKRINCHKKA